MKSKFEYFEVVEIKSAEPELDELNGKEGVVIGKSFDSELGVWGYAIYFEEPIPVSSVDENVLTSKGRFVKREDIYPGSFLTVSKEGELLGGDLKED